MRNEMIIGVLGGAGQQGGGLAFRWARKGHEIIIGSRSAEKAALAAQALNQRLDGRGSVRGASNRDAAQAASVVVLAVPYAAHLMDISHAIECDVLVCGDDAAAREIVIGLARDAGLNAWHAGALANSAAAEALASVLIAINKRYKIRGSGIRITGVPRT